MDLIKLNINTKVIPAMFGAYRFGLYAPDITPWAVSRFEQGEKEALEKSECVKITMCKGKSPQIPIPVVQLTPIGLEMLQKNFTNFLIEKSLYYTHLAILKGDLIDVKQDIKNTKSHRFVTGVRGFHTSVLDKGTYSVESIDKSSVILSDDMNLIYRVRLFETRANLLFREDQLEDNETELKKRFPKLRFKSVIKKLSRVIDNLTLTEMVDDLYDNTLFKSRLSGD